MAWIQYQVANPKLRSYTMPSKLGCHLPQKQLQNPWSRIKQPSPPSIYNRSFTVPFIKIIEESSLQLCSDQLQGPHSHHVTILAHLNDYTHNIPGLILVTIILDTPCHVARSQGHQVTLSSKFFHYLYSISFLITDENHWLSSWHSSAQFAISASTAQCARQGWNWRLESHHCTAQLSYEDAATNVQYGS